MKKIATSLKKFGLLLVITMLTSTSAFSAAFTAVASGSWSSSATWGGTAPSSNITLDQIVIPSGITVDLDNNVTINGALASLDVAGTLSTTSNADLTIATGTLSGAGTVAVDVLTVGAGAVTLFTGTITANAMSNAAIALQLAADASVQQTLTLASGSALSLVSGGSLMVGNNATVVIESGGLVSISGGTITFSGNYNVIYSGGSSSAGLELTGSGLTDVTIDVGAGSTVSLTSNLTVNGTLTLSSGTLVIGNNTLTFGVNGNLAAGGSGNISIGASGNIVVNASAGLSGTLTFSGSGNVMTNLTVNVGTGNSVQIDGSVTVDGTLQIAGGATLNINGASLTIDGDISGSGSLSGNGSANLTINASGGITADLNFAAGGQTVNNLTVNVGSGNSVELATDLTVNGTLNISGGSQLDITGVELTIGGDLTGSGSLSVDAGTDIIVDASGSLSSGISLTGGSGTVGNITINVGAGNDVELDANLTVDGTLTIQSGNLVLNGFDLTLNGDINISAGGAIDADAGSDITIDVNAAPSTGISFTSTGNAVGNLNIDITSGGSIDINSDVTVEGALSFSGSGSIDIGNNNLTIGASGSITGAGINAYIITSGSGQVGIQISAGDSALFPVGTTINFAPAVIELNSGSAGGNVMVSIMADVLADGYAGIDISSSQPLVDATWSINSDITANLDLNMEVMWAAAMQVNGFTNTNAYISHYVNGNWDVTASASANAEANGMFSLRRDNITSLSPFAVFDNNTTVSVAEKNMDTDFLIYPNPTADKILINHSGNSEKTIHAQIININGLVMATYEITKAQTTLSLDNLVRGSYFIRLYNEDMTVVKKILKL